MMPFGNSTVLPSLYDVYIWSLPRRPEGWSEDDWLAYIYRHERDVHILLDDAGNLRGMLIAYFTDNDTAHVAHIIGDPATMADFCRRFEAEQGSTKWMTFTRRGRKVRYNYQRLKKLIWATNDKV